MKHLRACVALFAGVGLIGTGTAHGQSTKNDSPAAAPSAPVEVEGYSGKLLPGDISFALHLRSDHTATANWIAAPGKTSRFVGTYSGEEGVYVVTLKRESGADPLDADALTLYLKRMGGMEPGQFTTGASGLRREIAGLQLSSIEGYKTQPGKAGHKTTARRSTNHRSGRLNTNRGRVIGHRTLRLRTHRHR